MVSAVIFPLLLSLLVSSGCLRENYRGRKIPNCGGLLLIINLITFLGITSVLFPQELLFFKRWLFPLTILVLGMGLLGILDDLFGTRAEGGFKGHFRELARGHLTTGVLKALGGGLLSLFVASLFSGNSFFLIVNAILLALCMNTFNLLDVRPGRAIKVFLILSLVIFLFSLHSPIWKLGGIFVGPILILFRADLIERCMLGDVGSNILGALIGLSFIANFQGFINLVILAMLITIQIYAERHSISAFILRVPALRRMDEWGRRK